MLKNRKIGFIGAGNMAEAVIKGLLSASFLPAKDIIASDIMPGRIKELSSQFKIRMGRDNREVAKKCDILILAVKPQNMKDACLEIHDHVTADKLVISIAAGVAIETIETYLQLGQRHTIGVIRTMPNTPAVVQEGVTALAAGKHVTKADLQVAHRIFEAIGRTVDVAEQHMDAVTGLSGSGPAYIFIIIEALSDAGVKVGLARDVSNVLAIQTVLGSAKLALESGKHPGELKNMVTSPGGTTIYGVHALEAGGIRPAIIKAVEEATHRSQELGRIAQKNNSLKEKPK
ncbi:MAG: pyrroline-5-carboxylate reductase [Nitrospinaceae bacterium]